MINPSNQTGISLFFLLHEQPIWSKCSRHFALWIFFSFNESSRPVDVLSDSHELGTIEPK